jgi:NDP-sugar pyrophosphorylase family protein
MIPVAILCGGHGTRADLPLNKCFVDVNGKPFILRIMDQMEEQGFTTFVLCRGTSGTLQALREARGQLGERFLVVYGDTLLPLLFSNFLDVWDRSHAASIVAERDGIDAGVSGYHTWMLDLVDSTDLTDLRVDACKHGRMYHYIAPNPWHEVGTPEALAEAREWFA